MINLEIEDTHGLYEMVSNGHLNRPKMRKNLCELGFGLASETKSIITQSHPEARSVLCVIILRGGAFLYPGFLSHFADADFCMLGLRRSDDGKGAAECTYCTPIETSQYDVVIFLDCITATGDTILEASRFLANRLTIDKQIASVICSSATGRMKLKKAGIGVIGFSLNEDMLGNVVAPDFGKMDAGDIFYKSDEPIEDSK